MAAQAVTARAAAGSGAERGHWAGPPADTAPAGGKITVQ